MEQVLRSRLDAERFRVHSAGAVGWEGNEIDGDARSQLVRLGVDVQPFTARRLAAEHVAESDLVLTATREHRAAVLSAAPAGLRKTFTLLEFDALLQHSNAATLRDLVTDAAINRTLAPAEIDIEDPFQRGTEVHARVADLIAETAGRVAERLNALV